MSLVKYTAGAANDDDANVKMNIAVRSNVTCFMLIASCKNLWNEAKINAEAGFTSRKKLRVKSCGKTGLTLHAVNLGR